MNKIDLSYIENNLILKKSLDFAIEIVNGITKSDCAE